MHAGISPLVNPASELYNEEVFRTKHLHFDLSSREATDPSGLPFAFLPERLPGFPVGYPVWFDMGLPMDVSNHRLTYLKDAGFFSPQRASRATLQFVGVDVARATLVFTRLLLRWTPGGAITGTVTVTGMPLPRVSASFWVRNPFLSPPWGV